MSVKYPDTEWQDALAAAKEAKREMESHMTPTARASRLSDIQIYITKFAIYPKTRVHVEWLLAEVAALESELTEARRTALEEAVQIIWDHGARYVPAANDEQNTDLLCRDITNAIRALIGKPEDPHAALKEIAADADRYLQPTWRTPRDAVEKGE